MSEPVTLGVLSDSITRTLVQALGPGEGKATARLVMEDVAGFDRTKIFTSGHLVLEPETVARVLKAVGRIVAGEPPQYVVGQARFMGMDFKVTPATLIPRPETEGLVDMITDDAGRRTGLRVLDIATGSGCIAIALARALVFPTVEATDISEAALQVAAANARALNVNVTFEHADILALVPPSAPEYDIIVSNPPYIAEDEKPAMDRRVVDYEPASALFVPDDDPLRFYRPIGRYAAKALRPAGALYLEINPRFAANLTAMLVADGFTDVQVFRDYPGRNRFIRARI